MRTDEVVIPLARGRRLAVRGMDGNDVDGLLELYHRLSPEDLQFRFFTGYPPLRRVVQRWAVVSERGGHGSVAVLSDPLGDDRIVGEVGYAPLPDGGGEFGITVAPGHRGWLGPYLFALLCDAASERGVPRLEADVACTNRRMLALLRRRGFVVVGRDGAKTMRVAVAPAGGVPTWTDAHDRPRIVAEPTLRWRAEEAARSAGFRVICCPGPDRGGVDPCPLLVGATCPLIADADAVVVRTGGRTHTGDRLMAAHRQLADAPIRLHETLSPSPDGPDDDPAELPRDASPDDIVVRLRMALDATIS